MSEQPAKPVVPALDLESEDSGSVITRKKTFSERVKGAGKSIKKIVTPRSRSSSVSEVEKQPAVEAEAKAEAKLSAQAKLKALGLSDAEVEALVGN